MMENVYVSFGSNLGKRFLNLHKGLGELLFHPLITYRCMSPFYYTEPLDIKKQRWFINLILKICANMLPYDLLTLLKGIEKKTGRTHTVPKGPRILDLDILFYNNETIRSEQLTVPHPEIHKRNFILKGMIQMGENIYHPILEKSIEQLHRELKSNQVVLRIPHLLIAYCFSHGKDCALCNLLFKTNAT
ncbi:MAG: 2-amino-4-hydroxy-6-hydroxymethyldihydropteridine diphosphokinase [Candidatus Fischerbacteria bacterium RBG_13_37_8]|uniref:2-amino-4-hydroxy-6-hydroxymethyldihydropteridine diphosphokinase n=1 Tax=Candidatus Fischerbacteria bacterium RBG_13_37_8 TaxID=1817863 RepID=A0A1F5VKR2_9BACT|nr:MAG: 2-amino-4-hydroxy-6-hydroxymethyldihydropteridine diphosphokinase [Candidatus Fischerbacteria bacterium RBG_13_37_8]